MQPSQETTWTPTDAVRNPGQSVPSLNTQIWGYWVLVSV